MAKIDRMAHAQMLMDHDLQFTGVVLAGIDEVGRGPLAGNVVCACVVMPPEPVLMWVDDSKKLSESRREKVFQEIMDNALYVGKFESNMAIVGFKSQFGHSYGECEPLFNTFRGAGLNPKVAGEGIRRNNFMATYLTGPLLVLNPPFNKYVQQLMGEKEPVLAFEEAAMELYRDRVKEFSDPATGVEYH